MNSILIFLLPFLLLFPFPGAPFACGEFINELSIIAGLILLIVMPGLFPTSCELAIAGSLFIIDSFVGSGDADGDEDAEVGGEDDAGLEQENIQRVSW